MVLPSVKILYLLFRQRIRFMHRVGLNVARGLAARTDEVLAVPDVPRFIETRQRRVLDRRHTREILEDIGRGRFGGAMGPLAWLMKRAESFGEADWA